MAIDHILLVYLPYIVSARDGKDIQREKVASYAEAVLKKFQHLVYTKALPSSLNGWESNILLCSDDEHLAVRELEKILNFQRSEVMYCLDRIKENTGKTLDRIIKELYSNTGKTGYKFPMEYLRCVSQFLAGEYQISSRFYNTRKETARILPEDIEAIKKAPGQWALVRFKLER